MRQELIGGRLVLVDFSTRKLSILASSDRLLVRNHSQRQRCPVAEYRGAKSVRSALYTFRLFAHCVPIHIQ